MKTLLSIRVGSTIKFVAVPLLSAGLFLSSLNAAAQESIPFKAMMQSAGAQAAVPSRTDAQKVSSQQASPNPKAGPITAVGKTEIGVGFLLIAAGVSTIYLTWGLSSGGFGPRGGQTPALYAAGAGATAGGVTLIALGFHRHKAR